MPAQGANECGIYVLRMTQLYHCQRLVEKILKSDVTASLFSFHFFVLYDNLFLITGLHFFFFFFQPAVEDWKAKYMFQLLFNPSNMLCYEDMPLELRDLIADLGLTSLSQSQSQTQ